jgi:hypothetical protein
LNISELQNRLKKIGAVSKKGAAIPERTLRDWAKKGLITGPEPAPRKTQKYVGRPKTSSKHSNNKIERGKPGRYYEWPEESYEEAAAVWSIRNLFPDLENKFKKNEAIIELRREADDFYFRFYFPNHLFSSWFWQKSPQNEFRVKINKELVVWVSAVEKARKKVRLDTPVKIEFKRLSNKRPTFEGMDPARKICINLKPLEGGGARNCIEIFVCYAEEPVYIGALAADHSAYFPGIVCVRTATEAGFQSSRQYWYYPSSELIAERRTSVEGTSMLWAFKHFPTGNEHDFKEAFLLEWIEPPDISELEWPKDE